MNYKGYDFFYVNGSSHTKGGGFESTSEGGDRYDEMSEYYKSNYNITWKNTVEINWGTRLSKLLGIKCHNESIQGGGTDRVIRKTYEFIENNYYQKDKFFIILETPDDSRVDLYYKPYEKHFLFNVDGRTGAYGTLQYYPKQKNVDILQEDFQFYFQKFYDMKNHHYTNEYALMGLYSYCKKLKVPVKLMQSQRHMKFVYDDKDFLDQNGKLDLITWCIDNKKQIKHETNFQIIDGHPGYFAHIEYAQMVKNWLDINLEPA
jgi:hypothetical protein